MTSDTRWGVLSSCQRSGQLQPCLQIDDVDFAEDVSIVTVTAFSTTSRAFHSPNRRHHVIGPSLAVTASCGVENGPVINCLWAS